ncbi:MAG: D-hexose-6-phosphate mutarotase [Gammaproteobacteria bacterium]|nr:D-hexose-6-phosphate mutarotase [Gammaproteobacteria bacterium]
MSDIAELNAHYGIADAISFNQGGGGLTVVEITHPRARARLALQGAQVLEWTPQDEQPVLWLSPAAHFTAGKAIRGGIPICWPWFGAHPCDAAFPAHGFARTMPWIVERTGANDEHVALRLRLMQGEQSEVFWPHACSLTLELRIGRTLDLDLATHNIGALPVTITEALHAYFNVADLSGVRVHGLHGCNYVDKTDGGRHKRQDGAITFDAETDRIYVGAPGECQLEDPGFRRRIRIVKTGSGSTIVWNPGANKASALSDMAPDGYRRMVCVESGNADDDARLILPGETHCLSVSYATERLG